MSTLLKKYFPQTLLQLSEVEKASVSFEFFRHYSLPHDLRYFPMMLKEMKMSESFVQLADYEYLRHWVEEAEELITKPGGAFYLNPSLQWVVLDSAAPLVGKTKGLYALWKFNGEVLEKILSKNEAEIINEIHDHVEFFRAEDVDDEVLSGLIEKGILTRTSFSP